MTCCRSHPMSLSPRKGASLRLRSLSSLIPGILAACGKATWIFSDDRNGAYMDFPLGTTKTPPLSPLHRQFKGKILLMYRIKKLIEYWNHHIRTQQPLPLLREKGFVGLQWPSFHWLNITGSDMTFNNIIVNITSFNLLQHHFYELHGWMRDGSSYGDVLLRS